MKGHDESEPATAVVDTVADELIGLDGVTEADIRRTLRGSLGSGSNMVRPRIRAAVRREIERMDAEADRLRRWLRREELRLAVRGGKSFGGI